MPLKLEDIYVNNFKSFHKATLKPGDFNVIIGANNAGKTNLVDLLEFIQTAIDYGLVAAVNLKAGFEKIKNFRSQEDFVEIKAVFKKTGFSYGWLRFPEVFFYQADYCDKYILTFRFTRDKRYFSEVQIESKSKIKKITEEEFKSFPGKDEKMRKSRQLLKGSLELDAKIYLTKESEEIDDAVGPDFEKKEHPGKYKRVSIGPTILEEFKPKESVLDESVEIEIHERNNIDRKYYAALFTMFFPYNDDFGGKFFQEEISLEEYLNHLKINAKFEDLVFKLFGKNIKTFNFDVNAIRTSSKTPQVTALKKDGANLQYILEYLKNGGDFKNYNQRQYEIITASLIGIVDEVEDVLLEEQRMGTDKIPEIIFKEKKGKEVAREDISDGTLTLLAIMTGLYAHRHRHYLVVIEEPERHLHMNAIAYLMEVFRSYSKETQLIITTQSSEVIRYVNPDSDNMVFVYRDNDSMSQFLSSMDIEEIKVLMERYEYNVDDIVRNEILGYLGDYA
jgi:predicted ATPase